LVLVQGDTTTAFGAALAAFYRRIPVAHVEAGLRTGNKHAPFPEEGNRLLTARLADYHFAPTEQARENLLKEGIPAPSIFVTGNTVLDALRLAVERIRREPPAIAGLPGRWSPDGPRRMVLVTAHRRENFGPRLESMCRGIAALARRFRAVDFVYPVHLNPQVREPVYRLLAGHENIHLIEPLDYLQFVALMDQSHLILTDSGGVQEEAPSLGKPVLVTRDTTERPEAVALGVVQLVGCDAEAIQAGVARLLEDRRAYEGMARAVNPYGDGHACERILEALAILLAPSASAEERSRRLAA
jgi:UDP-N-acetylglucosamine 2-epimerase (non-hydrolysing)